MTKSLAVFLQILVIWWVHECFVEVGAGLARATSQITNISILKDKDIQLLHGKGAKRLQLIPPSDQKTRGLYSVRIWEIIAANRYENPGVFLQISVAINLHEESRFIAEGIFTNSITRPPVFMLHSIQTRFMGSSCVKITYFVSLSRYFYQRVRLMLRWPNLQQKIED